MLRLREAVVVEGKHDAVRLAQIVDAPIVPTNGFRIFKDKEQMARLRRLAGTRGLVILTDSDSAGLIIRRHLCSCIPPSQIKQAYAPCIAGKERRKAHPSKEGLLGVEGIDPAALEEALRRAGVTVEGEDAPRPAAWMTKTRLFADGLNGTPDSRRRRERLLTLWGLPTYLSANRLVEIINLTVSEEEYEEALKTGSVE